MKRSYLGLWLVLLGCDGRSAGTSSESFCGNGKVERGEACDAGDANSDSVADACRTHCAPARCGDGVVDNGEECDDGAQNSSTLVDACRPTTCRLPHCGDGVVGPTEVCDDGNLVLTDDCPSGPGGTCRPASCGDGIIGPGESCDDADQDPGDACPTGPLGTCAAAYCGDGVVEVGAEECDNGGSCADGSPCAGHGDCQSGTCVAHRGSCTGTTTACDSDADCGGQSGSCVDDGCDDTCTSTVTPACGNGVLEAGELCDDGSANGVSADCLPTCTPARCGDGFLHASEGCDDGDGVVGDDCPDGPQGTCVAAFCGDGFVDREGAGAEPCDDGNGVDTDACSNACATAATCGDGVPDAGEACDLGAANSDVLSGACPTTCRTSCVCPACGDGVTDYAAGEQCDDGARQNGDGCDAGCGVEAPASCGDGQLDQGNGEQCDDGARQSGDGCDAACQIEPYGASCGDGTPQALERCEDANTVNGDGCNPTCNLRGAAATFSTFGGKGAILVDEQFLYAATETSPQLIRIDIGACLSAIGTGAPRPLSACDNPTQACGPTSGSDACVLATLGAGTESLATDGATLWFEQGTALWALDLTDPTYPTRLVAGSASAGSCGGALDGVGAAAGAVDLRGLVYFDGYVYFLDATLNLLRRFDPKSAQVVSLAGSCGSGNTVSADGQGLSAHLGSPRYLTSDNSGTLYFVDTNGARLRTYSIATGYVGTLAGGTLGYADGQGTAAQLERPRGITSDGTSLYWNEQLAFTVRQAVLADAAVSTLAGEAGCQGFVAGTGGSATPAGCAGAPAGGHAWLDTPWNLAYHYPSAALYVLDDTGIRRLD